MQVLFSHLYLRIWLAVLLVISMLALVIALVWYCNRDAEEAMTQDRVMIVRNAQGDELLTTPIIPMPGPPLGLIFELPLDEEMEREDALYIQLPPRPTPFERWLEPTFLNPASLFLWLLFLISLAIGLGAYPIVRRLTKRLEQLQQGVAAWGAGNLQVRVPVRGGDEIAFLARQFNQAAQHVQALVQAHKILLANASHELRSPLTRIRMRLTLAGDQLSPQARYEIDRNIAELDELIGEILLTSRLDAPQTSLQSFGEAELVDLTGIVAEECLRFNVELEACIMEVEGNARLLRRLVRNLLENAKRYGNLQRPTLLRMHVDKGIALVQVQDHGKGVPPEQREKIFEPFYRLPGASEKEGGVGLGLALVRMIARQHGGDVICRDPLPGFSGACFAFTMPVRQPTNPTPYNARRSS